LVGLQPIAFGQPQFGGLQIAGPTRQRHGLGQAHRTGTSAGTEAVEQAFVDRDAGGAQPRRTLAGDLRERVFDRHHHAAQSRGDQRVAARRRAAMVGAGLQRHVGGGTVHDLVP